MESTGSGPKELEKGFETSEKTAGNKLEAVLLAIRSQMRKNEAAVCRCADIQQ